MSEKVISSKPAYGRLYLVPAPLDFGCKTHEPIQNVLPDQTLRTAAKIMFWICENAKTARAHLKRIGEIHPLCAPLQSMQFQELPRDVHKKGDHSGGFDAAPLLLPAMNGNDMGLISEAGMPAIADPGSSVVRAAHALGIEVIALVGPISLMLALAASGLNGQNFAFCGYLPTDAEERRERIRQLESLALKTGQTQLFIETPYRNQVMLQTLLSTLQQNTRLAVASGLTLQSAQCKSDSCKAWKQHRLEIDNDTPAVFALGR